MLLTSQEIAAAIRRRRDDQARRDRREAIILWVVMGLGLIAAWLVQYFNIGGYTR